MRVRYSTVDSTQNELDSLPWLPLVLGHGPYEVEATGLVDSGATVNVLPYELRVQLGAVWNDDKAVIRLGGNLGHLPAIPLLVRRVNQND